MCVCVSCLFPVCEQQTGARSISATAICPFTSEGATVQHVTADTGLQFPPIAFGSSWSLTGGAALWNPNTLLLDASCTVAMAKWIKAVREQRRCCNSVRTISVRCCFWAFYHKDRLRQRKTRETEQCGCTVLLDCHDSHTHAHTHLLFALTH